MLATIKSGESAKRRDLRFRLMAERLTGQPQEDDYINAAMQWGIDKEADAIAAYEALTGELVERVGFIEAENIPVGTSPDGLVGDDGILSVKCPKTATHVRYMREGVEPDEHAAQNTHELWLTGRAWLDFVSFDPRMPDGLRLWRIRVTRTPEQLEDYGRKVETFLAELDREVSAVRGWSQMAGVA